MFLCIGRLGLKVGILEVECVVEWVWFVVGDEIGIVGLDLNGLKGVDVFLFVVVFGFVFLVGWFLMFFLILRDGLCDVCDFELKNEKMVCEVELIEF